MFTVWPVCGGLGVGARRVCALPETDIPSALGPSDSSICMLCVFLAAQYARGSKEKNMAWGILLLHDVRCCGRRLSHCGQEDKPAS